MATDTGTPDAPTALEQQPELSQNPNQDFRNSQLAQQTFAELKSARDELAAIKQAQADREAAEQQAKLEAEGNYKAALAAQTAKYDELKLMHEKHVLDSKLSTALFAAGVTNEFFVHGAISKFSGSSDEIKQYIESLKSDESNAMFFARSESNAGISPPISGHPTSRNQQNWAQIKEDLKDPEKARAASAAISEYYSANGKAPPGL